VKGGKIDYTFSTDRATQYLTDAFASKVAVSPGTTTVHTYNFSETSREIGRSGQTLDIKGTLARMKSFVNGEIKTVEPATTTIAPAVSYVRSYSTDYVGLSALIKNFATTHAGTYGVVLNELSGKFRRATYQGDKSFTTASTYKLYVAYSTLLRIESGAWHWSDQINGGRDLTKCFDDMIVISDNACALALLEKIGFTNITNEAHAIGCVNTSFLGNDGIKSTPEDLALLLGLLQTNQILSKQSSRDTLINAMKRNIYRHGIPAGESGTVADKVGFLWGLLHDAAIVYAPSGPYILVIMTDGSSWANIAELTRQIEALRIQ
jgi:beta-lactamase class A